MLTDLEVINKMLFYNLTTDYQLFKKIMELQIDNKKLTIQPQ